jgi:hypothetical protein
MGHESNRYSLKTTVYNYIRNNVNELFKKLQSSQYWRKAMVYKVVVVSIKQQVNLREIQAILERVNGLLSFDTTQTAYKTTRLTIHLFLFVHSLPR